MFENWEPSCSGRRLSIHSSIRAKVQRYKCPSHELEHFVGVFCITISTIMLQLLPLCEDHWGGLLFCYVLYVLLCALLSFEVHAWSIDLHS